MKTTKRHPCDIHKVARQCGIRLSDGARHYAKIRDARACYAPATLRRIGRTFGEVHLGLVLRLIVESQGNDKQLYGDTMGAVSALLIGQPHLVERGAALFEAFDTIDLWQLRTRAKAMQCGLPTSHILRVLLSLELNPDPAWVGPVACLKGD